MNQIITVVRFETLKNRKKFFILIIFEILMWFSITMLPYLVTNTPLPDTMLDFMSSSFGFYNYLIIILAAVYGGSLIADEFDKKTGFMLFPKVSKTRLFVGKFASQFLLFALNITIYYVLIIVSSIANYTDKIPGEFYYSYLFSLLYAVMLFSFVLLFSSFMRSTAMVIIVAILLLIIGFSMISGILGVFLHHVEPLYNLTYLGNIITSVFNFPSPRYLDSTITVSTIESLTVRTWLTPLLNVGAIMMVIYSAIFIVIAYLLFLRRESKG